MAVTSAESNSDGIATKSTHVSDPSLRPFLQSSFDPAEYLNATLPALSLPSAPSKPSRAANGAAPVSLTELSTQTQTLMSQLNAQTTRLSTVLTQLTDDILRSGGRLAYEVELLRGETLGLSEALADGLHEDIVKFVPGGLNVEGPKGADTEEGKAGIAHDGTDKETSGQPEAAQETAPDSSLPPYITKLRTLALVRSRLESVIKVFGEAMHWTLPPSEVSLASSLISVSAPEPGSEHHSREEKGREFAETLRNEISDLITGADGGETGYEAAMSRIQALRDLAQVWKGTAEEKARIRFVEGLAKLAEERQRAAGTSGQRQRGGTPRSGSPHKQPQQQQQQKSGGFLENLQRMRNNIYLE